MASNMHDIRQIMNLMESASESPLLEGWLDGIKNKLQGRMGRKARAEMADKFAKEWYKWLGQTRREGTMEDMVRYMQMRVGFNTDDVRAVLAQFHEETGEEVDPDLPGGASAVDEPEQSDDGEETADDSSEPEDSSEPYDDEPEDDTSSGRPHEEEPWGDDEAHTLDPNARMSDYGKTYDVNGTGTTTATKQKVRPDDVVENPGDYLTRGKLDQAKIQRRLASMEPGQRLVLGKKSYFLGDDDANESINEDSENDTGILHRKEVEVIMDISAARVNDFYLLDGPANDETSRNAAAMALDYGRGGRAGRSSYRDTTGPAPTNAGGAKASGQYDAKEMTDTLKGYNYPVSRIESLARKVGRSGSVSDMSDQDMDELALIGYAFFRSRT